MTDITKERVRAALAAAKATKGPYTGHLKRQCPPMGTDASVAWQSAMLVVNPHKVSIGQMMFWTDDQRALGKAVEAFVEDMHSLNRGVLDKDRHSLSKIGAW